MFWAASEETEDDMANAGIMPKLLNLPHTATAAEAATPKPLTIAVIIRNDRLVTKLCTDDGRPIFISSFTLSPCILKLDGLKSNIKPCVPRYPAHSSTPYARDIIVASAAPAAPICHGRPSKGQVPR